MKQPDYNLIVVAHPDDETLFFTSLLLQKKEKPWTVICTTDANADGKGRERRRQFEMAMQKLAVEQFHWLGLPDIYEKRLDLDTLRHQLAALAPPSEVYTHCPLGEYMHPHHQDVSYVVHELWAAQIPVYSVAYNCFPDLRLQLTRDQYRLKCQILSEIYGSETIRFINLLPSTSCEGFVRIAVDEVRAVYRLLTGQLSSLNGIALSHFEWLRYFLEERAAKGSPRLF